MPEPEFTVRIKTLVHTETGNPFVEHTVWYHHTDDVYKLVASWQLTPSEARQRGFKLQQAAEAAEMDAHLVMALRERKMPEEEIQAIVTRVRSNRGKP